MIKNIFLDAGGVILDEKLFEENSSLIITKIIKQYHKDYSVKDYWNDVDEAVYRFIAKVYDYVLFKNIRNINEYDKMKKEYKMEIIKFQKFELMNGIKEFLIEYSKQYKIGILGQYGNDFKNYLKNENIIQYISYAEIQDNYNITKPDPRYYEKILEKCNCKAEESIMIGDRIDKDIIPAKMIGMKTIRIKTGIHKNQEARIPEEIPDLTIENINEINMERIKAIDYVT